ncbi:hypothetical protein F5X97DRAFT_171689 [Nemania serpens]|nr:hypothetical protein F5X97DRAFT_171689 [Nemania serpens]
MASSTISTDANELQNQLDCKSPSKEICAHSTGSGSPCFLCPPWALLSVDGTNIESIKSPLSRFGPTSSEKNPLLGMLMSHFAGAFAQLELFGPKSSLSAHFDNFERLPNDRLQSGTVVLRKSRVMALENGSTITEIRISWEKGKPEKESEVDRFTASDALSCYNNLDGHRNLSGSIQPFTVCYKLTLESYNGHENDNTSHIVSNESTLSEMAGKIHGDLYHRSGETETTAHWTIYSPRSRSRPGCGSSAPERCMDIPVSYNYGFFRGEMLRYVVIRINTCTATFLQLSLQDTDHKTLEDNVDCKASQFDVDTQTSISHQRLFLQAACRYVIKKEGEIKDESTSNQQGRPGRIMGAMSLRERSAAQKYPGSSQSQSKSKPLKRQRDTEELESERPGGQTSTRGVSTKKIRVSDDTGSLACPFYKLDPWKFDRCLTYKLSKMSYVKQHLLRHHDAPHCNDTMCQHPINNKAGRDSCSGSQDCQKNQYTLYVMTAEQKRDIQRAAGRKITCEGKWYQIWSILFPGTKEPDSPFVKGHYFAEVISSIRTSYHDSRSHIVEETFRHEIENGHTYHEAFDTLLKKIECQALTQPSRLASTFHSDSSIETEGADWPVVRRSPSAESLSTDDDELLSSSPILGDHDPISSPSSIMDDQQGDLALGHSSAMLPCNPKTREIPSIYNGADEIESYELNFVSPGTPQLDQTYWPISYQEGSSLDLELDNMINYNDNTMDMFEMGAIYEYTYSPDSLTAANHVNIGIEFPD